MGKFILKLYLVLSFAALVQCGSKNAGKIKSFFRLYTYSITEY